MKNDNFLISSNINKTLNLLARIIIIKTVSVNRNHISDTTKYDCDM